MPTDLLLYKLICINVWFHLSQQMRKSVSRAVSLYTKIEINDKSVKQAHLQAALDTHKGTYL